MIPFFTGALSCCLFCQLLFCDLSVMSGEVLFKLRVRDVATIESIARVMWVSLSRCVCVCVCARMCVCTHVCVGHAACLVWSIFLMCWHVCVCLYAWYVYVLGKNPLIHCQTNGQDCQGSRSVCDLPAACDLVQWAQPRAALALVNSLSSTLLLPTATAGSSEQHLRGVWLHTYGTYTSSTLQKHDAPYRRTSWQQC